MAGKVPTAQNLDEISKFFVLIFVIRLFVAFDKQYFVDIKIALPIEILGCISNIAYWFTFDARYIG
jgi:hypothetical protein